MEEIRFNTKMKATENGYEYRGYKITRIRNCSFGTIETVWLTEGEVFGTLRDAKAYLDRKVMNEYIKYRESVSKKKHEQSEIKENKNMKKIIAIIKVDNNAVCEKGDRPVPYLEKEFGWLEQSGIFLKDCFVANGDERDEWKAYLNYLVEWAFSHKGEEFAGMTPACFDEFCEYLEDEDGEDDSPSFVIKYPQSPMCEGCFEYVENEDGYVEIFSSEDEAKQYLTKNHEDEKLNGAEIVANIGMCVKCGSPLFPSDIPEYESQCFNCDEDFYSIEQEVKKNACSK